MTTAFPWVATAGGLMVTVRLTPKGGRDIVDGIERLSDGRAVLRARVRAAPSGGEANSALVSLLAHAVGIAPSRIALVSGATGRIKRLKIEGEPRALVAALERAMSS
jgi:uncharacterized protein YggU (UPF0235/DUF167 family)